MVLDPNRGVVYISIAYMDAPFSNYERPGSEIDLRANRVELCVELGVPHPHSVTVVPSLNKAYTANKDAGTSQSWT